MDLAHIVGRIAESLPALDANDSGGRHNRRTGEAYLAGVKTMTEPEVTFALRDWWESAHPEDFVPDLELCDQEPYPGSDGFESCDLVVRSVKSRQAVWSIELKHIALVGDNGKNNDYGVTKMLSPYLKDRSLFHDALRLSESGFGGAGCVIVYAFTYSRESVAEARKWHPTEGERINNLDKVRRGADVDGSYSILPMIELADHLLRRRGLAIGYHQADLLGAWRHPAGGDGIVAGWEIQMIQA